MPEPINVQPRLYAEAGTSPEGDGEALARIARLKSLQNRIAKRPDEYVQAFEELGDAATDEVLELHDDKTSVRSASRLPKKHILEYFAKRDDLEVKFDEASEEAIFSDKEVIEAIADALTKRSIQKKTGVMSSTSEADPDAREASNNSRRVIFEKYLGRVATWHEQQTEKRVQRAG